MRLIDIQAFLGRERQMQENTVVPQMEVLRQLDDNGSDYAILSHRWGNEVEYREMIKLSKLKNRDDVRSRDGYQKLLHCCKQAEKDGFQLLWIDTCCIDKSSSAELSEAIDSMYQWYGNSKVCYVYLHDVEGDSFPKKRDEENFGKSNGWPEWFSRGWTLQELIAPRDVKFFNKNWQSIGDKRSHVSTLHSITRVPFHVLTDGLFGSCSNAAQILSWAANRKTTRVEDKAYSLLGLLGVHMPMSYGEGKSAFKRLQLEIIRQSNDHTIFAWDLQVERPRTTGVLADDPSLFRNCHDIVRLEFDEITEEDKHLLPEQGKSNMTDDGVRTSIITNAGILVSLPVISYSMNPSLVKVWLACRHSDDTTGDTEGKTKYQKLYLAYRDEARPHLTFKCNYGPVLSHGFTCSGTFPDENIGNSFTLSAMDPLSIVVFSNETAKVRFSVVFGNYFGQVWVHVIGDEAYENGTSSPRWAEHVRDKMWATGHNYVSCMPKDRDPSTHCPLSYRKHVHLPRSIWDAVVYYVSTDRNVIVVDMVQCAGCCFKGPLTWTKIGVGCPEFFHMIG
ncbi:hypothetical protein ID866_8581 [Astraeus odoratus]|nr:hypothetical protein ID866_8581 [Astraeus odoratus]